MEFNQVFYNVSEKEKLEYLYKLLLANSDLQRDFLEKIAIKVTPEQSSKLQFSDFDLLVNNYSKWIKGFFDKIDISEMDWENYHDPGYYQEEWEIMQDFAENEIESAFEPIKERVLDEILSSNFFDVIACLTALYEVASEYEIDDPNYMLGDMQFETMTANTDNIIQYTKERLENVTEGQQIFNEPLQLFFHYFSTNMPKEKEFARTIEKVLFVMVEKSKSPKELYAYLQKLQINQSLFPNIYNTFISNYENTDVWLKFAMINYLEEEEIAKRLIEHLHKTNTAEFINISNTLIKRNSSWNKFLLNFVDEQKHLDLYKAVYLNLAKENSDIQFYKKTQNQLSNLEKETFFKSIWDKTFLVQVYVTEKSFERAKEVVRKCDDLYNFDKLISLLFEYEPEFCFSELKKFVSEAVQKYRGRSYYEEIAKILKLAKKIPRFTIQSEELITTIYHSNNRLSALKDEMRRADLIK